MSKAKNAAYNRQKKLVAVFVGGTMGITIKSKGEGVFEIEIRLSSSYADLREAIREKLAKSKSFFAGSGVKAIVTGRVFSEAQKKDLKRMMHMDYDILNVTFADNEDTAVEKKNTEVKYTQSHDDGSMGDNVNLVSKNFFKAKSVFVAHTLRSGQRVECEGDVVVLGDVNDGAEVIAGGSIAVMGIVRGLVHAGATGRSDVVIAANSLRPKQLRISGKIAMFPEGNETDIPEIAEYKQGSIVIKPLRPHIRKK